MRMRKKIAFIVMALILTVSLFACGEDITLSVSDQEVTLKEGDTYQINAETNDESLSYQSSNEDVLTVSDTGLIEAVGEGDATVVITSNQDPEVQVIIAVIVEKLVELEAVQTSYTLKVGESIQISVTSNDTFVCDDNNDPSFDVDNDCNVVGIAEGEGTLTVTSVTDPSVSIEITIIVRKIVTLEVDQDYFELWVGKTDTITYTSNDDVRFEVEDTSVVSVSALGVITASGNGMTTIDVISTYDETVKETINVRVYNEAETIMISGQEKVNLNSMTDLSVEVGPDDAYEYVTWTSSDESVATVSETGVVTALKVGTVTITATSQYDETLFDEITIEVVNMLMVDQSQSTGSTLSYDGVVFTFDQDLFATINEALSIAEEGTIIVVHPGTYTENIVFETSNLMFMGMEGSIINGSVELAADNIEIKDFEFTGASTIMNQSLVANFVFENNTISDITSTDFIDLSSVRHIQILNNTFTNLSGNAIVIEDYQDAEIIVYGNSISQAQQAISIKAVSDYALTTVIKIERNQIDQVVNGIELMTKSAINITDYVRFNEVSNYTGLAAKANADHNVDFTLNYWGAETPVYTDFENITEHDLRGYYSDASNIISVAAYDPNVPVKLLALEPELEIVMGDIYQIQYEALPIGATVSSVKYITSDSDTLRVSNNGTLEPVRSGSATITLLLGTNYSVNSRINVVITTTPGIELTPSVVTQTMLVGDVFSLNAMVFPFAIKDEDVHFESDNIGVATIDQEGLVTTHGAGLVTFTASLVSDPLVKTEFKAEIFASLDEMDLLDLLTMSQVNYTTPHEWTAYGVGYNYNDFKYESVSRYYFGDIEINTSKIVPVSSGIRPGEPMGPHPEGVTQYNPYNVYWVVVHDTANTGTGAGALSHANYLWNASQNGTELWASWHFSIDDKALYQSLPETERGYHAGDGSSLPLQGTTYLGGGNRNGIGIEMGVNDDADVYRTWQRTSKLVAHLLTKYNLPRENMKYHNDFSGKDCPRTLRNAGLVPLFEQFQDIEYKVASEFGDAQITFTSNDLEYLDNTGRIIAMPDRAMTVSYTITVLLDGIETSRTFYSYLPGTIH
jgi:N-acetylmuramoyl-L-alanine amidase